MIEVRSKEEILSTLDRNGCLDGMPFMPEMFKCCGKRLRVYKRAHKTCDTINNSGGRKVKNAVHLEQVRCDGEAHGGCQAECLIFWKEAWLKRASNLPLGRCDSGALPESPPDARDAVVKGCRESDLLARACTRDQAAIASRYISARLLNSSMQAPRFRRETGDSIGKTTLPATSV